MNWLEGIFTYWDTDGTVNSFDFDNLTQRTLEVALVDGMCSIFKFPKGLWKQVKFELPKTTTKDDFVNVCLGRTNANGWDYVSKLISDDEVTITQEFGSSFPQAIDYKNNVQIIVATKSSGITGNNKKLVVRIGFAQTL